MSCIEKIVINQRKYFNDGFTRDISFRKRQLITLKKIIEKNENIIMNALNEDLSKSKFEAYATEIGIVYQEINYMLKNIKKFMNPKRRRSSITNFPSKAYEYQEPYGSVLIISPWNYPFQLVMIPLIGAIAAGNCAVIKPSEFSKSTSSVLSKILEGFPDEYICVIEGEKEVSQRLLEEKFDYIFFTGSPTVGKIVMKKASKHLTPVTLELGGKSPCIVDKEMDLDLVAKRIVWGKLLNSGQTCIAPDYVLVHKESKDELIVLMKKYIEEFYGSHPENNPDYPKIINKKHFDRLKRLIKESDNSWGGKTNENNLKIAPVILENSNWDSNIMKDEIFGPIIPILTYEEKEEIIEKINSRHKPLALYCFTNSKEFENEIIDKIMFGGGCINDTMVHIATSHLPFGGVGNSGMGSYHGKKSFYTFSHTKAVLKRGKWIDISLRYPPFKGKLNKLKKIQR